MTEVRTIWTKAILNDITNIHKDKNIIGKYKLFA